MGIDLRSRAALTIALLAAANACGGSSSTGPADATAADGSAEDGTIDTGSSTDAPVDAAGMPEAEQEAEASGGDDAGMPDGDATVSAPDAGDGEASVVTPDGEAGSPSSVSIDTCPGTIDGGIATALQTGGTVDAAMAWLYPYSGTVFPRGIPAPVLQWSPQSGGTSAVYLHLHSQLFDYKACFGPTNPAQLTIPSSAWTTAAAQSLGTTDPLVVELTTSNGTTVSGPMQETWTLATGPLAGTVYYDTYGSKLVPGQSVQNGAVMRLIPGSTATAFLYTTGTSVFPYGPCVSCHAVSASGGVLAAEQAMYPGTNPLNGKGSMAFGLAGAATLDPTMPRASTLTDSWGLSAVYPDGTLLLTSGEPSDTTATPLFPGAAGDNPGMIGPKTTAMYNTSTGAPIVATGLPGPYAMMPMFSPDGKHVVYNDSDQDAGAGHTLTVMDFDVSTKTFSNGVAIFHDASLYPGWPVFTPDSKSVIFALGNANNYASELPPTASIVYSSQLYIVSASGGTAQRLDQTSGVDTSASGTYLPGGTQDLNLDFYPSVSPVASGGYFWVYFTSRRSYGNLYAKGATDVGSKAVWVAAIDIAPAAGHEPSHPAFYLPGQELGSGNFRPTSALSVCKADGASCANGFECCTGGCKGGKCGAPPSCSQENDRCVTASDCCDAAERCLGGYCASVAP